MKLGAIDTFWVDVITAVVFFLIDLLWLGVVGKGFYAKQVGHMLREQVNWPAAIAFYLVSIAGVQVFVLLPALPGAWGLWHTAAWAGSWAFWSIAPST